MRLLLEAAQRGGCALRSTLVRPRSRRTRRYPLNPNVEIVLERIVAYRFIGGRATWAQFASANNRFEPGALRRLGRRVKDGQA